MNNPFRATNKDNLTDVIEVLPKPAPAPAPTGNNSGPINTPPPANPPQQPQTPQQVVNVDGDIVTLGQNHPSK